MRYLPAPIASPSTNSGLSVGPVSALFTASCKISLASSVEAGGAAEGILVIASGTVAVGDAVTASTGSVTTSLTSPSPLATVSSTS